MQIASFLREGERDRERDRLNLLLGRRGRRACRSRVSESDPDSYES